MLVGDIAIPGSLCRRPGILVGHFVAGHSMVGWDPVHCNLTPSALEPSVNLDAGNSGALAGARTDSVYSRCGVDKNCVLAATFLSLVQDV